MAYEIYKKSQSRWGIVYRIDARTSFDQGLSFRTKREAKLTRMKLNEDLKIERELNAREEG